MSDQQIASLIKNILGADESLRKQSEEQLVNGSRTNPNELFQILTSLMKNSPEKDVRAFCAVFLRKQLSAYSESSFESQLSNLSPEVLAAIKSTLFAALESETDALIRHQLCDAIGEIGGSLYEQDNKWPELITQIFALLQHQNPIFQDAALRIMSSNFEYQTEDYLKYKKELNVVFGQGFQNGTPEIQLSCLIALNALLGVIEPKQSKTFENLVPALLQSALGLIKKDADKYGDEVLSSFADIADAEPKFFKKDFKLVQQMMAAVVYDKDIDDSNLKETATEVLILILERIPSICKNDQAVLSSTVEMIFYNMVQIDKEIEKEWTHPKEGFSDEHENGEVDTDEISFGIQAIDRLMSSIGEKVMLPVLGVIVQKLMSNTDWRYPNAAIMALSQVGEYIEEVEQVKPIMDMVLKYYDNPNPRIRHSVCHCIGQISDDMNPKVQELYYEKTLYCMAKLLEDPIPRVVANAAACLANFVEGMSDSTLQTYLQPFLQKFFQILQNACSFTKESIISAVSTFAETAGKNFLPYYNDAVKFFFTMMETHVQKEYRQIRGQIIEVLTIMAHAVEFDNFKPYAEPTIQMMINLQNSGLDATDPLKSYLLSGWQRLCLVMGDSFAPYLDKIIPSVFQLLSKVFVPTNPTEKTINFQTYDCDEANIAINTLSVIIDEMGLHFSPYVQEALKVIIPLCNYATNDDIRKSSVTCLSGLVKACKLKDPQSAQVLTRDFIKLLWNTSENEHSANVIKDQIVAMRDCIEEVNCKFLAKEEIDEIGSKIFKMMKDSEDRKQHIEKFKKEEELEEEEVQHLDEDNQEEDSLYVALGDLMGTLFKTHAELTLGIVELLYTQVLSKALGADQSEEMHKFGIFIIDDMIEYLGIELIPEKWPHLCEALLRFACHNSCAVRQAAAYGIGVLSEKSHQVFNDLAPKCIQKLYDALQIPQGTEKPKVYGHCKDNVVSAMGKIIRQNKIGGNDLKQVVEVWFGKLPLYHDKEEAKYNHELLVDIMINNQDMVVQGNMQGFQSRQNAYKVITVYEQIYGTKRSNEKINLKIKQNLQTMVQDPNIQSNWETIMSQIPADRRTKFEAFIKA